MQSKDLMAETQSTPLRILLVEDREPDAQAFIHAFERSHVAYQVTCLETVAAAIERLGQNEDDAFDLVVISHKLQGRAGLDLCHHLFERNSPLPRIFLVDESSEGLAVQLQKLRFIDEYLVKDPGREYLQVLPLLVSEVVFKYFERLAAERHQRAVAALEKRYGRILETIADGVIVVDRRRRIKLVNPAAGELFGQKPESLLGRTFPYSLKPGRSEIEIQPKAAGQSERRVAEMRVTPLEWMGQPARLASLRDITYRKQMEKALKSANTLLSRTVEQLKGANQKILAQQKAVIEEERLKVLLQMAGATAHELNQPLTILLGSIELMGMNKDDPEKVADYIKKIETAGQRISRIVKQIQTIRHDEVTHYTEGSDMVDINAAARPHRKATILVVDPSETDFHRIQSILADQTGFQLDRVDGSEAALHRLAEQTYDVVFSEYELPDGTALELLRGIQRHESAVPLVVITGKGDELVASRMIQAGAFEYMPKSMLSADHLIRIIANTLEKARLMKDVKEAHKKMAELSIMDELTGLFNRRYFAGALQQEWSQAQRYGTDLVLCILDLDHFKEVNDRYGHSAGDLVLTKMGRMLRDWTRQTDVACRYGGEEFAIILPATGIDSARTISERFREAVAAQTFRHGGQSFQLTVSIGMAAISDDGIQTTKDLIDRADEALYGAKHQGRNRVVRYEPRG